MNITANHIVGAYQRAIVGGGVQRCQETALSPLDKLQLLPRHALTDTKRSEAEAKLEVQSVMQSANLVSNIKIFEETCCNYFFFSDSEMLRT